MGLRKPGAHENARANLCTLTCHETQLARHDLTLFVESLKRHGPFVVFLFVLQNHVNQFKLKLL